jgi:hypothetical protein
MTRVFRRATLPLRGVLWLLALCKQPLGFDLDLCI